MKKRYLHLIPHLIVIIAAILILEFLGKSFFIVSFFAFAIILGAIMLAYGAESAEIVISEGLAIAAVALLQVLPEFFIEATIAWAGDIPNMLANFTGANRILTGVGWPLAFFTTMAFYWKRHKKFYFELKLKREHSAEVIFLFVATAYFFIVFFKHSITIVDSIILGSLYIFYLFFVSRLPHPSRKKVKSLYAGIAKRIISFKPKKAKVYILVYFICGALLIYLAAENFYRGMLMLAASLGVSQFLFIQWIAPFLSEFPEKTSAFYWASKIKTAPLAMMNLISSKFTQWTLLLAMIPIVFSVSSGRVSLIPVTGFLSTELMLTIVTSLYASIFLMKMRINVIEVTTLFILWIIQFIYVGIRPTMVWLYVGFAFLEIIIFRKEMLKALSGFKYITRNFVFKKT